MKRVTKSVAAAIAALMLVLALASCGGGYDYIKKDLTKYLKIGRADYIGIPVTLTGDYSVTDQMIEDAVRAICIANRTDKKTGTATTILDWGYDTHIYYWGEYTDEYGNDIQFSGGSNMTASSPSDLTLGSGSFIDGFESGLVASRICPGDTNRDYNTVKGLEIGQSDVVYLYLDNYLYTSEDGEQKSGSFSGLRVDLANPGLLGAVFAEQIARLRTGDSFDFGYSSSGKTEPLSIDVDGDGVAEKLALSGSVAALSLNEKSVQVTATFPEDYSEESLRGKEARFHVVVDSVDRYDVPNERSLTAKMVQAVYSDFESTAEGDAFLAYLREYLQGALEKEQAQQRQADIETEIWKYLMENANFTGKYPKKALKENRKELKSQMQNEYRYYKQLWQQEYQITVNSFEDFAENYYDIGDAESWDDYFEKRVKKRTREEILVYSIVKAEKWDLTDAEYESGKAEILAEYAALYDMDEQDVFDLIGRKTIYENTLYKKLLSKLCECAVITER